MKKVKRPIIMLAAMVCFLLVGGMEAEDQIAAEQQYCENVNDKTWPNYKEIDCSR